MTIVLFCIMLKHYVLGILAALTISLAGILSIAINKKSNGLLNSKAYLLEMIGALLVFSLGLFLYLSLK